MAHGATFAAPALLGADDRARARSRWSTTRGVLLAVYERRGAGVKPTVVLAPQESSS